jgi:fructokinase
MTTLPKVACFGEILWDVLPDERFLGGAPLNVAIRLQSLGADTTIISAVGTDALGIQALEAIKRRNLATLGISKLKDYRTGTVKVSLEKGIANYKIAQNVAWDHISINANILDRVSASDALVFGSLALREEATRGSLEKLIIRARYVVFDLNLRPPFYQLEELDHWVRQSDFLKFNEEELAVICAYYQVKAEGIEDKILDIAKISNAQTICVTLGAKGAVLYHDQQFHQHPGYPSKVADTIGAGDSFLACLLYELLTGNNPVKALDRACGMGAIVASKNGANCQVSPGELDHLTRS